MKQTTNILNSFGMEMPTLPENWSKNLESWEVTLPIKAANLLIRIDDKYEITDDFATFARTPEKDVIMKMNFLGMKWMIDFSEVNNRDVVTASIYAEDRPYILVLAFMEHLRNLAGQIGSNSISTSMEEIIPNSLWIADNFHDVARSLEAVGSAKCYEFHYIKSVTRKYSHSGYVLWTETDPYTGTPLYHVETKEEFHLRKTDEVFTMTKVLQKLSKEISKAAMIQSDRP